MKTVNGREAKIHFRRLLDTAIKEPISITRNGRQVAVLLSVQDFDRLSAFEDAAGPGWRRRASGRGS